MELRQLKYFAKAADKLNFTEASSALFITQSTLSQQIKQLETELGVELFDRVGKKVFLTEAGRDFLPYAEATLRDAEYGIQCLKDLQDIRSGEINIGVIYSMLPFLPDVIAEFTRQYPAVKINIGYHQTNNLHTMLHERKYDLILCYQTEENEPTENSETIFETYLSVVTSKKHPLSVRKSVSVAELNDYPLALPTPTFYARTRLDQLANKHNIKLNTELEINAVSLLQQLASGGHWITVLSSVATTNQPELKAIPLADKLVMRSSMIWLKDTYEKRSVQVFKEILKKHLTNKI